MKVTTVGLDLAKQVLSVHGVHEHRKAVLREGARLLEKRAELSRAPQAPFVLASAVIPQAAIHRDTRRASFRELP